MVIALALGLDWAWAARPRDTDVAITGGSYGATCHAIAGAESQCAVVLAAIDEAWLVQVEQLGFNAPLPDGGLGVDDGLDVYLSHFETGGAGGAYVTCDGQGADCTDFQAGDGLASTPSFIVIDPELDDATLRRYCHHEFNHVLQYATDFEEPFLDLWEGTATAAETWTDPTAMLDQPPLLDYQNYPWVSAVLQDGYWLDDEYGIWGYYEYGAVLWVMWMDQRWGDGNGSVGPALWAAVANDPGENEPDLLDAWDSVAGSWREDVLVFAADRGTFGTDQEPAWLTAFGGAPEVPVTQLGSAQSYIDVGPLYPLGMQYIDVTFSENSAGSVGVQSDTDVRLVPVAIPEGATASSDSDSKIVSVDGGGTYRFAAVYVPGKAFDADTVLQSQTAGLARAIAYPRQPPVTPPPDCASSVCGGLAVSLVAPVAYGVARRRRR